MVDCEVKVATRFSTTTTEIQYSLQKPIHSSLHDLTMGLFVLYYTSCNASCVEMGVNWRQPCMKIGCFGSKGLGAHKGSLFTWLLNMAFCVSPFRNFCLTACRVNPTCLQLRMFVPRRTWADLCWRRLYVLVTCNGTKEITRDVLKYTVSVHESAVFLSHKRVPPFWNCHRHDILLCVHWVDEVCSSRGVYFQECHISVNPKEHRLELVFSDGASSNSLHQNLDDANSLEPSDDVASWNCCIPLPVLPTCSNFWSTFRNVSYFIFHVFLVLSMQLIVFCSHWKFQQFYMIMSL